MRSSRARPEISHVFVDLPVVRRPIYKWVSPHNIIIYLPMILCTSGAHLHVAHTANTRSAIDDTISGVPLWVHTYGGGGGDTITRFSVVRIVSLGRITRAGYEVVYYIYMLFPQKAYNISYILEMPKKYSFSLYSITERKKKTIKIITNCIVQVPACPHVSITYLYCILWSGIDGQVPSVL